MHLLIKYRHHRSCHLQVEHKPPNSRLEDEHTDPQAALSSCRWCSTSELHWRSGGGRVGSSAGGVGAAGRWVASLAETKAVGHIEEDVDVAVDTTEELLAGTHGEDGDVGQGMDPLSLVTI